MSEVSADIEEVVSTVQRLQHTFEDLVVGGLQFLGPKRLPVLEAMQDEFRLIGADHLAQRLGGLIDAIRTGHPRAAATLLQAQSSVRVFERLLTLETVANQLMARQPNADDEL